MLQSYQKLKLMTKHCYCNRTCLFHLSVKLQKLKFNPGNVKQMKNLDHRYFNKNMLDLKQFSRSEIEKYKRESSTQVPGIPHITDETRRRNKNMLGTVFLVLIYDALQVSDCAPMLQKYAVQFHKAIVSRTTATVTWSCPNNDDTADVYHMLCKEIPYLKSRLAADRLVGAVPKIIFLQDLYSSKLEHVSNTLHRLSFGEHPPSHTVKIESESSISKSLEKNLWKNLDQLPEAEEVPNIEEVPLWDDSLLCQFPEMRTNIADVDIPKITFFINRFASFEKSDITLDLENTGFTPGVDPKVMVKWSSESLKSSQLEKKHKLKPRESRGNEIDDYTNDADFYHDPSDYREYYHE